MMEMVWFKTTILIIDSAIAFSDETHGRWALAISTKRILFFV
jgi:hypothetical protein